MPDKAKTPKRWRQDLGQVVMKPWILIPLFLFVGAFLRMFVEAFKIPSGGMYPTFEIGDHVFVSKLSYGWLTKSSPERADLMVFDLPYVSDGSRQAMIQRVIGLAGDEIEVDSGHALINGWRVPNCFVVRARVSQTGAEATEMDIFVEFLGEASYLIGIDHSFDNGHQGPFRVPSGEVFTLGDNRNNSFDSRAWKQGQGGGVSFSKVTGRATMLWFPYNRLRPLHGEPMLPTLTPLPKAELAACLAKRPKAELTNPPPPKPT